MKGWKITGAAATAVIVFLLSLYLIKESYLTYPRGLISAIPAATFVGTEKCRGCHKAEYDLWKGSHHDCAMDVASEETVLGDFNDATFEHFGVRSRFYRKDSRFFVHTQGPKGKMGDFPITHTFGVYPLQQYLVPFPGGRHQCLPIAWDAKEHRWYYLYPDAPLEPNDWLYWTNNGQNWNGMCAECHSTNLKKNYNIKNDTYKTTWSDIDVGCEACHGPGSEHVKWAELPDMARPHVENYDLTVKTSELGSRELVELCAPCHARRAILGDYTHAEPDLLDSLLPSLLTPELYFSDGQILEEVYVYGSFTQSKMYRRDVRCSDCHEVHSIKLIKEGNALCLQCHRDDEYNTKEHHFHKKKGEQGEPIRSADGEVLFDIGSGAECIQCHMPGRYYMGIDYRRDHSFRIPRPDLSIKLGVPNACNRCHFDKTDRWSDEHITKWYGPGRRRHYGTIIETGRNGNPEAREDLIRLAMDPLYPVIVRATALSLLNAFPGEENTGAYELALIDEEALIRRTAVESLNVSDASRHIELISPLLYDPVKAVRTAAASRLAGQFSKHLGAAQQKVFQMVLEEYVTSMEYSGDFAFGRYNLGNLSAKLNRTEEAIRNYRAAIKIDNLFYPAKVNLAMLYNQLGENDKAEELLREVVAAQPDVYEIAYSLGLLLSEEERYGEAVTYLEKAVKGMPKHARAHYNLGLLLQQLKRDAEAEVALLKALELEHKNMDYMYALADYYLKREKFARAKQIAEDMIEKYPANPIGYDLLNLIKRKPGVGSQ